MRERSPDQVRPNAGVSKPRVDTSGLHVASPEDTTDTTARDDQLNVILRRADMRDLAAERRDREAEGRDPAGRDHHGAIERDWAGRDRDRAAEDRADLLALLRRADPSSDSPGDDEPQQ
ncbi:MAG: hypothetical protein QOJ60_1605 [Actinomycetota bacterium]|jgi:hypothetical protein|nr:hypothetical protein [Actinomycetota bacterium]